MSALADATFRAGTPAIPLVKALTDQVRKTNPEAARFVHWGATSQDVADSAMSLLLKRAEAILTGDLLRLEKALRGSVRAAQEQRHGRADSASGRAAGDLRTQGRWLAGLGSSWKTSIGEVDFVLPPSCSLAEQAAPWHRWAIAE